MATVGEQLTTPEEGWKRYDDTHPAIKYTNLPMDKLSSIFYNSTIHYIFTSSNVKVEFDFIGTKLRLISSLSSSYSQTPNTITIDGVDYNFKQYDATQNGQKYLVYEIMGLENKRHSLKIVPPDGVPFGIDAIDIESTGRLLHSNEVLTPKELEIGKRIRCHYQATASNTVGTFSNLGEETYKDGINDFLPASPTATPDGDFYFIMVEDWNGKKRLIADRNIQNYISWDTLNNNGLVFGSPVEFSYSNNLCVDGIPISGGDFGIYTADKAFDGIISNDNSNTWASSQTYSNVKDTAYIGYKFNVSKKIERIILIHSNSISASVDSVKIQGSNDNTSWNNIYITNVTTGKNIISFKNNQSYSAYRLLANSGIPTSGWTWNVKEIKMFEVIKNNFSFTTRLLTGGVTGVNANSSTDKNNEWDRYIVSSTLNNSIIAGDDKIWNWNGSFGSWTSTTPNGLSSYRVRRGSKSVGVYSWYNNVDSVSSSANVYDAYRPMLEIKSLYETFVLHNGKYKKYDTFWSDYSDTLPTTNQFISDGMSDLSVFDRKPKTETIVMNDDINGGTGEVLGNGKVFKKKVDLNKYFDLISLNVK